MNSGLPGSPRRRGPPRHAYQYFLVEPSASFTFDQLIPLALMRMFYQPFLCFVVLVYTHVLDHRREVAVAIHHHLGNRQSFLRERTKEPTHIGFLEPKRASTHRTPQRPTTACPGPGLNSFGPRRG